MFKYIKTLLVIPIISILLSTTVLAEENRDEIRIRVDDVEVNFDITHNDQPLGYPEIKGNRTMIPLRAVTEGGLGYKVKWEQETRTAVIEKGSILVRLKAGDNKALVNGEIVNIDSEEIDGEFVPIDTKSYIKNNRLYVPVRFLVEAMKDEVDYQREDHDSGKIIHNVLIKLKDLEQSEKTSLSGTAEYGSPEAQARNIKKIIDFMGDNSDSMMSSIWTYEDFGTLGGMAVFNPIGGKATNEFFYVHSSSNRDYDVVISIKNWFRSDENEDLSDAGEVYKNINPTVKEILNFYLPKGAEKLYEIVDNDYNLAAIEKTNKYIQRDLQDIIGNDGQRVLMKRVNGRLEIYINKKR